MRNELNIYDYFNQISLVEYWDGEDIFIVLNKYNRPTQYVFQIRDCINGEVIIEQPFDSILELKQLYWEYTHNELVKIR